MILEMPSGNDLYKIGYNKDVLSTCSLGICSVSEWCYQQIENICRQNRFAAYLEW
jgi:hypothetical protein